jgi:hypothetical protein
VVIFAISLIAFGTFCTFLLVLSIALIPLKNVIREVEATMPNNVISLPIFWASSAANLFIFISWVICGIGVLHLKEWSRQWLRIVMAVYVINSLINIWLNIFLAQETINKIPYGFLIAGIAIAFSYYLGVIYFFSHPNIVRQFKYKSREY